MNVKAYVGEPPARPADETATPLPELVDSAAPSPRPAVDLTPVVVTAEIVIGAVAITRLLARRPSVPRVRVTMGPGGWVSVKGGTVGVRPAKRPWGRPRQVTQTSTPSRAPIWARVLSAVPLQVLSR